MATRNAEQAIEQLRRNRELLYSSGIGVAQKALEDGNNERALKLLTDLRKARTSDPYGDAFMVNPRRGVGHTKEDLRGYEWYYLWRLASRKLATIKLGENPSPARLKLQGGAADPVSVYKGQPVAPVAFGAMFPEQVVAAGSDGVVKVWFGLSSSPKLRLPVQNEPVKAVAVMGLYQFITADRTAVRVWGLPHPDPDAPASEQAEIRMTGIAKLPEKAVPIALDVWEHNYLLAIGHGSTFMLWDVLQKEPITLVEGSNGYPAVRFVEEGKTLITSDGRNLTRWNVQTKESSAIKLLDKDNKPMTGEESPFIKSLAFTPDGRKMVTSSDSRFILWTAANAEATAYSLKKDLPVHGENFFRKFFMDLVVAISPDGKLLATGDGIDLINGGGVKLWDISGDEPGELFTLSPDVAYATSLSFSSDSKTLAVGSGDVVQLWDVAQKESSRVPFRHELESAPATIRRDGSAEEDLRTVRSPDGKLEALSGSPDYVVWWNPNSDTFKPGVAWEGSLRTKAMAFSPDGKLLAVGGGGNEADNGLVTLWDTKTRAEIKSEIEGHKGVAIFVTSLAFSPDNNFLATGGTDKIVELWDISKTPAKLLPVRLEAHASDVTALAFSPDGKTIASGDDKGTVNLWSAASYQLLLTLQLSKSIKALAFSKDSETLYTRDSQGEIRFWEATPRQQVENLERSASVAPRNNWTSPLQASAGTRPSFHWKLFPAREVLFKSLSMDFD